MTPREFDKIYRQLYLPLGMFALKIIGDTAEASDLVNGVFTEVWNSVLEGSEPENLKAYLYRAVRNRALSYVKGQSRLADAELAEEVPEEEIDTSERDARLWRALDELPDRCREIFLMSKRDGMSNKEIAEELGISLKTVETQITKAYKRLRAAFGISTPSSPSLPFTSFLLPFI